MFRNFFKIIGISLLLVMVDPVSATDTLQSLVERTLSTNPDVQARTRALQAVEEELAQARAGYGPSVELGAGVGVEQSSNSTTRATGKQDETLARRERSITLRQMVFDGFATKGEVDRQTARIQSAAYSLYDAAEKTALKTAEVYIEVLRSQKLVQLARENLEAHEQTRDQIELRSRAGIGRGADFDQVVGRYSLAMANLISAEANLADARSNYLRVTGEQAGTLDEPKVLASLPETIEKAEAFAAARHPTLKSAEADVEAAQALHQTSLSPFYPQLEIQAGGSLNNNVDGQRGDNDDSSVMLRMRYQLFSSGKNNARRRQTAFQVEEAREVRNNSLRQVIESTRLSWNQYEAGGAKLKYLEQHLDASRRSLGAYQKQFDIGKRSLLDLLDSKNELYDANRAYVNTKYDRLFAIFRIQTGMGFLLDSLGIDLPVSGEPTG